MPVSWAALTSAWSFIFVYLYIDTSRGQALFFKYHILCILKSVHFSHSVVSGSLRPHEWQHARPPCPSPTPGDYTNSRRLLKLMSIESVMPSSHLILCRPLLLLPPIPPSIRDFPMSQLFTSGGQSIGVSASTSVLPMNTQD